MGNLALTIAASGIDAQQAAMDTVAENLANANTPGYIQESPTLVATASYDQLGNGAGVTTLGASQAFDGLLVAQNQHATGALAQTSALQQVLEGVQSAFPVSTSSGTSSDLSAFWQSWDALAQNPSSGSAQANVVTTAQTVVTDLQASSAQIASSSTDAQSELGALTTSDNQLLSQVANLNTQIVVTKGSGASANSLIDQQNAMISQLAQDVGAVGTAQANGTTNVAIGSLNVVSGSTAATLSVAGSTAVPPGTLSLETGAGTTVPTTAGTAAGLLAAINQYLPAYQTQLDSVANNLSSTVNTQLAAGFTATGAVGTPLFTGTPGSGVAGLTVSSTIAATPSLLAASATATNGANNGANAQTMANLYDVAGGADKTYQAFVEAMGSQISGVTSQVTTQTSVANAAQADLAAVSGVDTNTQMVQMLNYQQAYQASAKVISTVDTLMQALLAAV